MDSSRFYPICDVIDDGQGRAMIIGKNGSLTYVVLLHSPEAYSLSMNDLESRHAVFVQAFSQMPDNSYVHKQDTFLKRFYHSEETPSSYLAKADYNHFEGREYFTHTCVIGFTLAGLNSLSESYVKNPLSYSENMHKEDIDRLHNFLDSIEYAINNLSSLRNTRISFLGVDELKEYIFNSANFYESSGIKDIHFSNEIISGPIKARMYAITDEEFLPVEECPVCKKDHTISADKSELYMSFAETLGGVHIHHNHTYNQIFYFYSDKKMKKELCDNLDDHIKNRGWDKVNIPPKIERMQSLVKDINQNNESLCYAHFSILLWDEDAERLNESDNQIRAAFDISTIKYYLPSYGNLAIIFGAGIIGGVSSLPRGYMFPSALSLAATFLIHYSTFRDDLEGVLFNDRLFQIPLRKDIWDSGNKRVKARNAVVIAPTGSGKSFTTNNIVQQLLEQGYTVVAVEFGNSFKQLCYLYPDISIHVEYDQKTPLGINSFDLEGDELTPDKKEFLVTFCLRLWRTPSSVKTTVALRKFIDAYYKETKSGHSFEGFYFYLKNNHQRLCEENGIKADYFEFDSFFHVCSEFVGDGAYANLCTIKGIGGGLKDKRFIHFELTKVKSSPFVSSVVMNLLFDVINNKILSDPSKKGYIIFDEYAETAQMKSNDQMNTDIHQTVALFYQKIRKENGAVITIIQSPVQLPDNQYTKGIIANTQILYVLEGNEVVYDAIIDTFKIKNIAHQNQMKSIQNNYSCARPYSECWIRFGENYAITVRLEASKRKYLAFQTQGEIRSALDQMYESNGHDMQKAIEEYYVEHSKK